MELLKEIRIHFADTTHVARRIKALPNEYPAYTFRSNDGYGVVIECNDDLEFSEKFSSCKLFTSYMKIENVNKKYLILNAFLDSSRNEFATLCAQFVNPGEDGLERKELMSNPSKWWKQWKELLGNVVSDKKVYDVIAELFVLKHLYDEDKSVKWFGSEKSTQDIESDNISVEVKSTIKRYETSITISNQFQLRKNKCDKLFLYFVRMEKSNLGISINDLVSDLLDIGYDSEEIEKQLYRLGYERGMYSRDEKYKILEKRKYIVDDEFPKITVNSFKDNQLPSSIIKFQYTIDLDGLDYFEW